MQTILQNLALIGDVWVIYLLIAASLLSLAVMVERWMVFSRNRGDVTVLMDGLGERLEKKDIKGALEFTRGFPNVEGRVAVAGLEHFSKGAASVEEAMSARIIRERKHLGKKLIILSTLGNNAPFIGLFGTVLGIIKAFNDLAVSGSSGVSVVMAGISSALIATAFGIAVAVPAVIANNYFRNRLNEVRSNAEEVSKMLLLYIKAQGK